VEKKMFVDNLALLIVKNKLLLQFVKSVVKTSSVAIVSLSSIPFLKFFSHNVLLNLVEKTKPTYVLFLLDECYFPIASFDI
jgi:hypothetical protein